MHPRPDGSLPPTPRHLHHDPYVRARRASGLGWSARQRIDVERQAIVDGLDALDAESVDWMHRRRALVERALAYHEWLWPPFERDWARRPPRPDQAPLPPIAANARPVWGQHLRTVSLALLRRHGQLALRELHMLLHLYGFEIQTRKPVQALADALGFETDEGRVERVARGVYRARWSGPAPLPEPDLGADPLDWYPTWSRSAAHEGDGLGVVGRWGRDGHADAGEQRLAVAVDALGVGPVERQAGEELGGHAPALAGVVAAAATRRRPPTAARAASGTARSRATPR